MFDDDADRDLAILATTDLEIEPLYLTDPGPNWLARGHTELELITACEKQIAYLHAVQARALSRFAAHRPGNPGQIVSDFAADEIALATCWTRATAGARLNLALTLTGRLPATLDALADGRIDLRRAQRLAEVTDPLPAALARQVEDEVLPHAGEHNSSQLARAARQAIAHLDPAGAEARHQTRRQDRRVELRPLDDAMAELRAILPAPQAVSIHRRLSAFARAAAPGDPRTMDQRRADTLIDLLLPTPTTTIGSTAADTAANGHTETPTSDQPAHTTTANGETASNTASTAHNDTTDPKAATRTASAGTTSETTAGHTTTNGHTDTATDSGSTPATDHTPAGSTTSHTTTNHTASSHAASRAPAAGTQVQVIVPATTLLGLDDQPAELAGYGPIPASLARELAADATWRRLLTDPVTGTLLDTGTTGYRPPAAMVRYVRARDRTCIFPGCHRPADTCDIDHRTPYPAGATTPHNLACLCRHHHRLKHQAGWTLTRTPDGTHTWTTPTGRRHHRPPTPLTAPAPPPPRAGCPDPADDPPPF
jgi:hypothetical protein